MSDLFYRSGDPHNYTIQPWPPETPKKSKRGEGTLMLILGICVALAGVVALAYTFNLGPFSGGDGKVASVASAAPTSQPGVRPVEQAPKMDCASVLGKGTPCRVRVGRPFVWESTTVQSGWKVFRSEYGNRFVVAGYAKNTGNYSRPTWLAFRFFNGSKEVGALMCFTTSLRPGEVDALSCVEGGKFGEFDRVTVETAA